MGRRRLTFLSTSLPLVMLCAFATASATTVVPMTDEDLALSVRAVVEGTVVRTEPIWDRERAAVYTYVTVDVERTYKGDVPPGQVVLKQLGGSTARHATAVHGAPDLAVGRRALLFLNTDSQGALRVAHMAIGHYEIEVEPYTGREIVVRATGAHALERPAVAGAVTDRAPKAEFVASLLARLAAGAETAARYEAAHEGTPILLAPPEYTAAAASDEALPSYTFLGNGYRWFEPDSGISVGIRVNTKGAPTESKGLDEARAALNAWSSVSGSKIRLFYAGQMAGGGRAADGVTGIAFGDPANDLDDPVNCSGVLAVGGVKGTPSESMTIGGKRFSRILEGDVVVNRGFECLLADSIFLSHILTHEVGHVLGVGHSSTRLDEPNAALRDATMFFGAQNDARGASLRVDDSAAVRFLYRDDTPPGPLAMVTESVPEASPGALYSFELRAVGGETPRLWSVASGALPSGMRLAQDGRVYGTPTGAAASTVTVKVRDSAGAEQVRSFSFNSSQSPAPFLSRVGYDFGKGKLTLTGLYLAADASIVLNGEPLPDSAKIRFKANKGRLVVSGPAARSAVRAAGRNTVAVVVGGKESNTVAF